MGEFGLVSSAQELLASELLQQDLVNLRVRSKDSAHASRRTDHHWKCSSFILLAHQFRTMCLNIRLTDLIYNISRCLPSSQTNLASPGSLADAPKLTPTWTEWWRRLWPGKSHQHRSYNTGHTLPNGSVHWWRGTMDGSASLLGHSYFSFSRLNTYMTTWLISIILYKSI